MAMNISMLKKVDNILGRFLVRTFPRSIPRQGGVSPQSVLVIRPGGMGDAVLLIPCIAALNRAFPECHIDILAEKRNAAVFEFVPQVRKVYLYESLAGLKAILQTRYDVVIDSEQWYCLSAVVARLVKASLRIGFATNIRARLFTNPQQYSMEQYEAVNFFRLLAPLGIALPETIAAPFIFLTMSSKDEAERVLAPLEGKEFITLFPGASCPEKVWGKDKFKRLVRILSNRGYTVVVVGGDDVISFCDDLSGEDGVLSLAGKIPLAVTAAVVDKGVLLISGDSGILHIAAGLGKATVSLFGPSDPRKWGPPGSRHMVVCKHADCAPCSSFGTIPRCTDAVRCLSLISPEDVVAEVGKLLPQGWQDGSSGNAC